jgi:cell division septum initiation protein DivIVA
MAIDLDQLIDKIKILICNNKKLAEENQALQKRLVLKEKECLQLNQRISIASKKITNVLSLRQ